MNRKSKLILCIVTAMLLSLLPSAFVSAEQTEKLDLTALTADDSGPGWTWDYDNRILLLDDLDMDTGGIDGSDPIIKLPAGSTIALADGSVNQILSEATTEPGIYSEGDLEIIGNGQLVIEARGTQALFAEGDLAVIDIESLVIISQSLSPNWIDSIVAGGSITLKNIESVTAVSSDSGITAGEDLHIENVDHLEVSLNDIEVSGAVLSGQSITIRHCGNIELFSPGMMGRGLYAFAADATAFIMIENCEMLDIDAMIGIMSSGSITIKQSSINIQSLEYAIVISAFFGGDYDSYGGDIEFIRSYARLESDPMHGVALMATSDLDRARIILTGSEIIVPENAYIVNAADDDRWTGQSVTDQPELDEATDPSMMLSSLEIAPIASDETTNGDDVTDEDQDNDDTDEPSDTDDADETDEPSDTEDADETDELSDTEDADETDELSDAEETDDRETIPETGENNFRFMFLVLLALLSISMACFVLYAKQSKALPCKE